jgi:phosphatidylserine/phosphatidylglycerophosphate/cardiolipin synthase-like enzyme
MLICRITFGVLAFVAAAVSQAQAVEYLCDPAHQNCRDGYIDDSGIPRDGLIDYIRRENRQLDVAFWFMEDNRYAIEIVNRWKAGVPVRVIIDPRANTTYPLNAQMLDQLRAAGIPMRKKVAGGIMHWKTMIFHGQNVVEFGGANYSVDAWLPVDPYKNYVDEAIYFTDDSAIVDSFRRKYDDLWVDTTNYTDYANVTALARECPLCTISPDMNFPPGQDYANRSVKLYDAETQGIDVIMYRITDRRHSDAMLRAQARGVPVRLYTDQAKEYRNPLRLWHAWNVDRMWVAGIPVRVPNHLGINHEKAVILRGQSIAIFGSSNWTSPSANSQQEHNYFTKKTSLLNDFIAQFERKWFNTSGVADESKPFVPLPPDKPVYQSIANGAPGVPTAGQNLVWFGGPWAHLYDIYFGTDPLATTLFAADQPLGPSLTTTQMQSFALPPLQPGTTYYWKIVSKTAALIPKEGPIWSFTTAGSAPPPATGAKTIVVWMANVAAADIQGNWTKIADGTAAGGAALNIPDQGAAKIAPALATPTNFFKTTFQAEAGTAYHLWVRLRAQNDSTGNDSVHVQFDQSLNAAGSAILRFGTASSAEVILQDGSGDTIHGWGWADNGWGVLGENIFFANSGTQTLYVQQREDGAIVDQVVLSPDTYLSSPPGAGNDDATILQPTDGAATTPPPAPTLPADWTTSDIGPVAVNGSASESSGTFTVQGSGADIWNTADAFRYAYKQLTGDSTIVARVASVQNVNVWTKAGVMVRQTLDAGSPHASMFVTPARGLAFQRRTTAGATSLNTSAAGAAPAWVKVSLSGQTVTASVSTDGVSWTQVGQETIAFSGPIFVGLAVTSHDNTRLASATFDNVTIAQP